MGSKRGQEGLAHVSQQLGHANTDVTAKVLREVVRNRMPPPDARDPWAHVRSLAVMGRLLLLFIVLPAVELALLIEIGRRIGTLETLGLIVVTGAVGAVMARSQGLRVLSRVREEISAGAMPASSLLDGVLILVAAALLVTPGVLTDAFGFLCLVPGFRTLVKREAVRRIERAIAEGRVQVSVRQEVRYDGSTPASSDQRSGRPMINVTPPPDDEPR